MVQMILIGTNKKGNKGIIANIKVCFELADEMYDFLKSKKAIEGYETIEFETEYKAEEKKSKKSSGRKSIFASEKSEDQISERI